MGLGPTLEEIADGKEFGRYKIIASLAETKKSYVAKAEDPILNRFVALKVLKPGMGAERVKQIVEEGKRIAKIEEYPNVVSIYDAGIEKKLPYIVMQLINGKNLQEELDSGVEFNENEGIAFLSKVVNATSYLHSKEINHGDLNPGNVLVRDGEPVLIDLGGRINTQSVPEANDTRALGHLGLKILERTEGNRIERYQTILKSAKEGSYDSPERLGREIENLRREIEREIEKHSRTLRRRTFLKWAGGIALLGLTGLRITKEIQRRQSLEYLANEVSETDPNGIDFANRLEDLSEGIHGKVSEIIKKRQVERTQFPYWIPQGNAEWVCGGGESWFSGYWPSQLLIMGDKEGDRSMIEAALEWIENIRLDGRMEMTESKYLANALGHEITGKENLRTQALYAAEKMENRFDESTGHLRPGNKAQREQFGRITNFLHMIDDARLLRWSLEKGGPTRLKEILENQALTTIRSNLEEDGSSYQLARIDREGMDRPLPYRGYPDNSIVTRSHARAIRGLVSAYEITRNGTIIDYAKKMADLLLDKVPESGILPHDLRYDSVIDSAGTATAASALIDLSRVTGIKKYEMTSRVLLQRLSSDHLETRENHQGILRDGCGDAMKEQTGMSTIYGDFNYIEAIGKLNN